MTALPANTIGMVDRGYVAPGMAADVTVFDPATIIDHATYEDAGLLSEGIRYVLVNGRVALRDGAVTGEQAGAVLNRSAHMPSRPMSAGARRVSAVGKVAGGSDEVRVAIDVSQAANAARAKGTLRLTTASASDTMEATELSVLQTTEKWAALTARVRLRPSGEERSAIVIVDRGDPASPGVTHVTVAVDGRPRVSGVLQ